MNKIIALFVFVALATAAVPGLAQAQVSNSFTADEAREARDKGNVVPLRDIFERLKRRYGGYQADAKLFDRNGGQVYVIDWMTEKGERLRITVNAQTGRIISPS